MKWRVDREEMWWSKNGLFMECVGVGGKMIVREDVIEGGSWVVIGEGGKGEICGRVVLKGMVESL